MLLLVVIEKSKSFTLNFLSILLPQVISSTTQQGQEVPIYFKILDMINIFQAVAIFIIFVLKTDIRNSLENKYPLFRRKLLFLSNNDSFSSVDCMKCMNLYNVCMIQTAKAKRTRTTRTVEPSSSEVTKETQEAEAGKLLPVLPN